MTDFTTMEKLACKKTAQFGAVIRNGSKVIYVDCNYRGRFFAEIYEFIDEPDIDFDQIECRLSLLGRDDTFKDGGQALKWALNK